MVKLNMLILKMKTNIEMFKYLVYPFFFNSEIATRGPHGLESDVWSLGCMLYTLIVGCPPFDVS